MSQIYGEIITTTSIDTVIRIRKNVNIKHIRPHLFRESYLTNGQIELQVVQGSEVINSFELDYTELNSIGSQEFIRGFVRFDIDAVLRHDKTQDYTEYKIRIHMKNYIQTPGADIWLVSDLNTPIVDLFDTSSILARGYEIYSIVNF